MRVVQPSAGLNAKDSLFKFGRQVHKVSNKKEFSIRSAKRCQRFRQFMILGPQLKEMS